MNVPYSLHSISVKQGDIVSKGNITGPHLHWSTYLYGTSVNPELFVRNEY